MKYLKIEDNRGLFSVDGRSWLPIDAINKEHLLVLIDKVLSDDFEMDEFRKDGLANQAHQIIYKNLYDKFRELQSNRSRFKDESESMYKAAIEKYGRKNGV
jgi:hypothetical protein